MAKRRSSAFVPRDEGGSFAPSSNLVRSATQATSQASAGSDRGRLGG
jgi:hypothetical protein